MTFLTVMLFAGAARAESMSACSYSPADGADQLARNLSDVTSPLEKYQVLLHEYVHHRDARLVDADGDGELGPNDEIVRPGHPDRRVGADLVASLKIGVAANEVAHEMADAGLQFGSQRFSSEYFEPFRGSSRIFQVKAGVKPSDALDDILKKRKASGSILDGAAASPYSFDCATADVIFDYRVAMKLLGRDEFDRQFAGLFIGPHFYDGALARVVVENGSTPEPASAAFLAAMRPGDYGYFNNWDVSDLEMEAGWSGENVHYLGNGLYYGHPMGIATKDQIVAILNGKRIDGSTRSASLDSSFRRITPAIFDPPQ